MPKRMEGRTGNSATINKVDTYLGVGGLTIMVNLLCFSFQMISLFEEKHMKNQAGVLDPQTVLVLLGGLLILIMALLIIKGSLVY